MTTRRTTTRVEIPLPPASNGTPKRTSSSATNAGMTIIDASAASPWLPTPLEMILLSIYPGTLVFGSLFSTLTVNSTLSPYSHLSQSYAPEHAPSYFAKKSNIFNVYFVKQGWLWITVAFLLFVFTHASLGPKFDVTAFTRRRVQALARYTVITAFWIAVTQWFFGPPIVDRGFRLTGGQCAILLSDREAAREELGDVKEALTHAACKLHGGQWSGGHDISGHVFLLVVGSAMLWFEVLPAVLGLAGLRQARRIQTEGGLVRSAAIETTEPGEKGIPVPKDVGWGVKATMTVAAASMWMLLMTAAYFHTWFEKFTGFVVASIALYVVYFVPRGVPAVRRVLGMPGA
ncbi:hypothetical protein B0A48_11623 [Cryoendolithus antarcticus]|uniref:Acyl-coenzyme A diphosphatase SCS3 n=1 Tax=Cryoendolithus antarcticus TaxID=1507870 RepID=A0A1V8SW10_9PEZI|nr:hypothetical protein B0A48_11623 [Cryoendolithus antarcticus]